ncbi:hypothetical protein GJV85_05535 [Sulfurimonas aquatica]|uniref:Uncharacterized protein n=1 Tax=Sulfurimonas aquatica TaxID=2672570 RepID=A0A975AZX8_9BACT|nr:hypothetical protein [Sulfurimonas aquatica]QSZ41590.1 hypothetical protein GJV85_05535 [Sulfurimonas aquatica]
MSLKNDIEMVKEELTSEEKFFEKAVVTEKFVKKYKNLMIGSVVVIVLLVAGNITYTINKQNTIDAANETLEELQKDTTNQTTLARLNSLSPALHDVWVYSQAVASEDLNTLDTLKDSKAALVADLASYTLAQSSNDLSKLEAYSLKENAIYKDLARVQAAVLLLNSGKIDEAHSKLSMISIDSALSKTATALMHYGVK